MVAAACEVPITGFAETSVSRPVGAAIAPPEPEPQGTPVPDSAPLELAWTHCVEPVIPVSVSDENEPAAGVVPPIAGGVAALAVAKVPNAVPLVFVQVMFGDVRCSRRPARSRHSRISRADQEFSRRPGQRRLHRG